MSSVDQIRSFLGTYGSSWDADQEQWMMDLGQQYFGQVQNVPPYAIQLLNTSPSDHYSSDPYLSHQDPYGIGIHEWELPSSLPHQNVPMFLPNHDQYNQQYDYVQPSRVQVPLSSSRLQDFQQLETEDVEVEIISQATFDQAKKKARSNNGTGQHGGSRVDIQLGLGLSPVGAAVKNSGVVVEQGGEAAAYRCPICMDKITEATSTKCGHIFCQGCLKKALAVKKQCPTCRRKLRSNSNIKVFLPEIF